MGSQSCVPVKNEWDIVNARQLGRKMAKELGFGSVDQARITTAISELARNIYLYAEYGTICVETYEDYGKQGLKIIATDTGPGIKDLRKAMQDGYTTSGGLGTSFLLIRRWEKGQKLQQ
jgi:serine/threonine-protein kinase RsbT